MNLTSRYLTEAVAANNPNAKANTKPYNTNTGNSTICQGGRPLKTINTIKKITKAIKKSTRHTSKLDSGNRTFGK